MFIIVIHLDFFYICMCLKLNVNCFNFVFKPVESTDTTKTQLGEPMSLLGLLTWAEMTQRPHQNALQHGWQLKKAWDQEHIAQSAGNSKGWIKSFLVDSVKLNLFQVGHLTSASSRLLGWPLLFSGSLNHLRVFCAASSFWEWLLRHL